MVDETRNTKHEVSTRNIGKTSLKVLLCIYQNINTNKLISNHLKKANSTISDVFQRLKDKGLIYEEREFNVRRYTLTKQGEATISCFISKVSHINTKDLPLRCHRLLWVSKIVKSPQQICKRLLENNWIEAPMKNWNRYIKDFESFKIVWNPQVVQYYVKPFYTSSKEDYYNKSLEIVESARKYLQEKYQGLILGTPEETAYLEKQELAREFDPLAMFYFNLSKKTGRKFTYRGKNIDIDYSKGVPEVDFKHKTEAPIHQADLGNFFDELAESPSAMKGLVKAPEDIQQLTALSKELSKFSLITSSQTSDISKHLNTFIQAENKNMTNLNSFNHNVEQAVVMLAESITRLEQTNKEILYHLESLKGININRKEYFG